MKPDFLYRSEMKVCPKCHSTLYLELLMAVPCFTHDSFQNRVHFFVCCLPCSALSIGGLSPVDAEARWNSGEFQYNLFKKAETNG
jgi:hypothetical protein